MVSTKANLSTVRSMNTTTLLKEIRKREPISRADLSKQTGLNPATVSAILSDLIRWRLVRETGIGTSSGGRRPTMLELDESHYYVIGLDMGTTRVQTGIVSIYGKVRHEVVLPFNGETEAAQILEILDQSIQLLLQKSGVQVRNCLGIGMGIHGLFDSSAGISIFAPAFRWSNIPVKDFFAERYKLPLLLDNDARAMALGEKWFGGAEQQEDFIFMNIGMGIGSGLFVNGQLVKGARFGAGEIGHVQLVQNDKRCYCGKTGCLSTVASGPAIADRAAEALSSGESSLLRETPEWQEMLEPINEQSACDPTNVQAKIVAENALTGLAVYEAALQGDQLSQRILLDAGEYIGKACAMLVNVLNPEKIIFGGGVSKAYAYLQAGIEQSLKREGLADNLKQVEFMLTTLGEQAGMIGAATLVWNEFFNAPNVYLHAGAYLEEEE